jgi:hypothetical protein
LTPLIGGSLRSLPEGKVRTRLCPGGRWIRTRGSPKERHRFRRSYHLSRTRGAGRRRPQDFLLAAPLFRVCPFFLRGWRLFVRVVPVLFSTALITSLSARAQKFLCAACSTSTKSANAATVPLVGFAVSRYLPATRHSRAPRKRPANGWPTTPADLGRVAPGCRKRVGATAVPQLDLSCSACHSIEPGAQLVLVGVAPPRSFSLTGNCLTRHSGSRLGWLGVLWSKGRLAMGRQTTTSHKRSSEYRIVRSK